VTFGNIGEGENETKDIIQYIRVNSHEGLPYESHKCKVRGIYRVIFDNSYSLMKAKTLKYDISLTVPESEFQNCVEF